MLRRVREDFLLAKLRTMLKEEKEKPTHERDPEAIATIKRVMKQLEKQFAARPKAR